MFRIFDKQKNQVCINWKNIKQQQGFGRILATVSYYDSKGIYDAGKSYEHEMWLNPMISDIDSFKNNKNFTVKEY